MAIRKVTTLPVIEKTVGPQYNPKTFMGNWSLDRKPIDRIVIHTMVGTAAGANAVFNNPHGNTSAHYGVLLSGELWHWLDEDKVGFHAGVYSMNQRSIGIEHEDNGYYNGPRTDALYQTSSKLVYDICRFYQIPIDRFHIIGHKETPYPTGCPDALDIDRIVRGAVDLQTQATDPFVTERKSVRDMLVTKASNLDTIANYLQVSEEDRRSPGFGQRVVDSIKVQQTIYEQQKALFDKQMGVGQAGFLATNSGTGTPILTTSSKQTNSLSNQSNSIWTIDIFSLLKQVFGKRG